MRLKDICRAVLESYTELYRFEHQTANPWLGAAMEDLHSLFYMFGLSVAIPAGLHPSSHHTGWFIHLSKAPVKKAFRFDGFDVNELGSRGSTISKGKMNANLGPALKPFDGKDDFTDWQRTMKNVLI
ncbi:hypothetical protein Prudu_009295 [Prunus dulcis]|uniref:Uncharacterized protein n=1 Tax=Prunus dulcis TaxID=3755 RepID=A0A4Y1R6R6_PRUDU|nr:hypothetical protein Prudu_009295 [Prunus dulcis]